MDIRPFSHRHLIAATLAGLALRWLFFVHYPFSSGDTWYYESLARDWFLSGIYGIFAYNQMMPMDVRMPGYPAFLNAVHAAFGLSGATVASVQAAIDMTTCIIAALLAARLAPPSQRTRVAAIALWLTALCPFTAHYSTVVLTETLATSLTTVALFIFVCIFDDPHTNLPLQLLDRKNLVTRAGWWLLAGLLVGLGTLVRPETPLILIAAGIVLAVRWRRRRDWSKLTLAGMWMAVGLLLPLTPWAARNAHTLGRVAFLSPRFAETPGDYVPLGFYSWTRTWMVRYRDAYTVIWKVNRDSLHVEDLPDSAFDSASERARVAAVLERYNQLTRKPLRMMPLMDREFVVLARERTAQHPFRTYVFIPLARAWFIWFTPRIELLPYSGRLWPPGIFWQGNPTDFSFTLAYGILGFAYVSLAWVGMWRCRAHPALALFLTWLVVRTAFLTQMQTVEPRYVIECFPLLLAFAAVAFIAGRPKIAASAV